MKEEGDVARGLQNSLSDSGRAKPCVIIDREVAARGAGGVKDPRMNLRLIVPKIDPLAVVPGDQKITFVVEIDVRVLLIAIASRTDLKLIPKRSSILVKAPRINAVAAAILLVADPGNG